jgi:hypothetical protein
LSIQFNCQIPTAASSEHRAAANAFNLNLKSTCCAMNRLSSGGKEMPYKPLTTF